MPAYLLAIDQGTTSTRAMVFDEHARCRGTAAREFTQHYPQPGWVEHDAEEIWQSVGQTVRAALAAAGITGQQLTAIGLTNQRETIVLWDRATGKAVAPAIVWQDRRTTPFCRAHAGDEAWLRDRTGLMLDPYFSATKIKWLLDHDPVLHRRAEDGELAAGTIDTFLIARLTGQRVHATDVTNASRTLLFDLRTVRWEGDLCHYFGIPESLLPEVRPSAANFGQTHGLDFLPDGVPIAGVAGDQQAALFGQGAFEAGETKCTYGTGAFLLQHTGHHLVQSRHRLLTTLAAQLGGDPVYALEGSVFVAGAAVQWLRDGLKIIETSSQSEELARQSPEEQPILFVPAFVGLGAPHWVPEARGVLFGITRETSRAELARAALEGVAFQVAELVDAMTADSGVALASLRVDGGMVANDWFLQCQADLLGIPVERPDFRESTALGAALLAGLHQKVWASTDEIRTLLAHRTTFPPFLDAGRRQHRRDRWHRAVQAAVHFYKPS